MSLESTMFAAMRPIPARLSAYGFEKKGDSYVCAMPVANGMCAAVTVENGTVSGKVTDTETGDEYIAMRLEGPRGSYAAAIREKYLGILKDIAEKCFEPSPFITGQAIRIAAMISDRYAGQCEFIFAKNPHDGVWRHEDGKWYALIMRTGLEKIDGKRSGLSQILTLKSASLPKGAYPAFHMNKKSWISLVLDDTFSDEAIMAMVEASHDATQSRKAAGEWIIPANPRYFDLDAAFRKSDRLYWHQAPSMKTDDIVYIYYGAPYSSIRYKCIITETGIPSDGFPGEGRKYKLYMRLLKLAEYKGSLAGRAVMRACGVNAVRGPRYMPEALKKEICRLYP